ncbi:negative regulator of sigma-B (phosphoserine phosphatase) [Bacillus ectoiniformans]|uniref:PP2C family serine/threonine-protein phosphatase n=1 Tax=Bacillus ectoiniformans TaxID=1494429 RepID=UPI00195DF01E|nr:PP2C family serine/threonine-protein phosphatase [Bacillus ectoiniformans]MBM7649388.1 negative regulator of sigma-B (phosphoserine phosphatase) [Bacillus ectoiniformans]
MTYLQKEHLEVYANQASKDGKPFCGDSYYVHATDEYLICVLADGLGSGEYAYNSSSAVTKVVEEHHHESVDVLMQLSNEVLHHKRGAAVAIFKVFFDKQEFEYSCVGNIRFYLYTDGGKLTYPLPVTGYLSGRPQKYRTQRFVYELDCKFILHSDGLNIMNVKSLFKNRSIKPIAYELEEQTTQSNDDATFIIGSLL